MHENDEIDENDENDENEKKKVMKMIIIKQPTDGRTEKQNQIWTLIKSQRMTKTLRRNLMWMPYIDRQIELLQR